MISFMTLFVISVIWTVIVITSMRTEEQFFMFISIGCMIVSLLCLMGLLISYRRTTSQTTDARDTSTQAHIVSELVIVEPKRVSIGFENVQSLHIAESESSPHKLVVAYQSSFD
jgi:hypothetical protein